MATTKRLDVWKTTEVRPYSRDLSEGRSPQSTGGVVLTQVRRRGGHWQRRKVQVNGRHVFATSPESAGEQIL